MWVGVGVGVSVGVGVGVSVTVLCMCVLYVAIYALVCVVHVLLVVRVSGCTCVYTVVQTVKWAVCSISI